MHPLSGQHGGLLWHCGVLEAVESTENLQQAWYPGSRWPGWQEEPGFLASLCVPCCTAHELLKEPGDHHPLWVHVQVQNPEWDMRRPKSLFYFFPSIHVAQTTAWFSELQLL